MEGKKVLVTGATAGIGKVAARELAKLGAQLILVGRNAEKTEAVRDDIRRASGNDRIEFLLADLSRMADVKRLAADFRARHESLDVLINNAGAINMRRYLTADGLERTLAVNHLAYFILGNLLVPPLSASGRGRMINVASEAHRGHRLDFDDVMAERGIYNPYQVYGRSKLCNILFTREMARRVVNKGITVNALHPGFVASDFLSKGGIWRLLKPIANVFAISEEEGAKTTVYLASSPEVEGVSGKYFHKCRPRYPSRPAQDDVTAQRLWALSEKLTGVDTAALAA